MHFELKSYWLTSCTHTVAFTYHNQAWIRIDRLVLKKRTHLEPLICIFVEVDGGDVLFNLSLGISKCVNATVHFFCINTLITNLLGRIDTWFAFWLLGKTLITPSFRLDVWRTRRGASFCFRLAFGRQVGRVFHVVSMTQLGMDLWGHTFDYQSLKARRICCETIKQPSTFWAWFRHHCQVVQKDLHTRLVDQDLTWVSHLREAQQERQGTMAPTATMWKPRVEYKIRIGHHWRRILHLSPRGSKIRLWSARQQHQGWSGCLNLLVIVLIFLVMRFWAAGHFRDAASGVTNTFHIQWFFEVLSTRRASQVFNIWRGYTQWSRRLHPWLPLEVTTWTFMRGFHLPCQAFHLLKHSLWIFLDCHVTQHQWVPWSQRRGGTWNIRGGHVQLLTAVIIVLFASWFVWNNTLQIGYKARHKPPIQHDLQARLTVSEPCECWNYLLVKLGMGTWRQDL